MTHGVGGVSTVLPPKHRQPVSRTKCRMAYFRRPREQPRKVTVMRKGLLRDFTLFLFFIIVMYEACILGTMCSSGAEFSKSCCKDNRVGVDLSPQ